MRRSPWLVVQLVLAGACFGQRDTLGLPCDFDSQCDLGQECRVGECTEVADTTGCMAPEVELAPLASRVLLVVDRSAAMADEWDDDGEPGTPQQPRWDTVVAALAAELAAIDDSVELGLVLAPSTDGEACGVAPAPAVAIAAGSASACIDALPIAPQGGAPIGTALAVGVEALRERPGPASRSIVLVLAGAPSCDQGDLESLDGSAETTIADAFADGIPTVVVGVAPSTEVDTSPDNGRPDGVAPSDAAMTLAIAGGRTRAPDGYYRADNGVTLGLTVRDAVFAARGCALPRPEGATDDIAMRIDGESVPRIETCDAAGFVVREDAIEVCGNSCAQLKLTGTAIVTTGCE